MAFAHFPALYTGFLLIRSAFDAPWPVEWVFNHALAQGWTAYALQDEAAVSSGLPRDTPWTLTVWVKCSVRDRGVVRHKP